MTGPTEDLSASLEDYVKTIALLAAEKQTARAKDISARMEVNMSSVTGALRALADKGLVNYAPYEHITLTDQGSDVAREIVRKHEGIRDFLVKVLSVDEEIAEKTAHNMEHAISSNVLERFIQFIDYLDMCPRAGTSWADDFKHYIEHPGEGENCEQCLTLSLEGFRARKERTAGATVFLNNVAPGNKVKVVSVNGNGEIQRRIVDMGVTPGTVIEVERIAPLGDPMEVRVKGYHLSFRLEEAATISVEPL